MLLPLLLLLQSGTNISMNEAGLRDCVNLARADAASAIVSADELARSGGGYLADICAANAYVTGGDYEKAADKFAQAAALAEAAKDSRAANLWAQAGNAAIASGQASDAIGYLDKALEENGQMQQKRAEILIDRARAQVIGGNNDAADNDLSEVRRIAPENASAWLLSAALARRSGDLDSAQNHIRTAAGLSPRDAAVALEAGNIAAAAKAYAIAREQWQQAIKIAPESGSAQTARKLIAQLDLIEADIANSDDKVGSANKDPAQTP